MQDRIPHNRRIRRPVTLLALLAVAGPAITVGQDIDRGTLLITSGIDTVGIEQFLVRETAAGIEVSTSVSYPRRRPRVTIDGLLRTTSRGTADFTSMENSQGPTRRVLAQFSPDRAVIRRFSDRGEAAHEFPAPPSAVVVFDSLFGFFAVVPDMGPVTVTNPQRDRFEPGTLADLGTGATTVNGRRVTLRHLTLVTGPGTIHLWFEGRSLQKVEDLRSGLTAQRIPPPRR